MVRLGQKVLLTFSNIFLLCISNGSVGFDINEVSPRFEHRYKMGVDR